MKTIFEDAQTRLDEVFSHVDLTDDVREKLQPPKMSVTVSIPIRMDDGSLKRSWSTNRSIGTSSP